MNNDNPIVGALKFNCEDLALCCFNTTSTYILQPVSYGGYGRRRGYGGGYGGGMKKGYGWKK